jgi:hypothetical protein
MFKLCPSPNQCKNKFVQVRVRIERAEEREDASGSRKVGFPVKTHQTSMPPPFLNIVDLEWTNRLINAFSR